MTAEPPANDSAETNVALGPEHPHRIGPYRILRVLGEGGIGLVYLAEQSEPVRRRVALKVIRVGMDTRQVVARFESERQALAVMDHPCIAHVLHAGAMESGRPYFVMECVDGAPITAYCDARALGTEARVRLFLDVCAAVQHAHQKGVIHRDLKPSNILVGESDGAAVVKVIDFGIAKAIGPGLTERTVFTRVGQLLGTPAYMSPEQAEMSGLDVDTRTDIYSLGVVLYELLAGALPVELAEVPDYALPHALRETDVPRASARFTAFGERGTEIARLRGTNPGQLRRELRDDLDWIVAKAMHKDRTQRYPTAEALAADLHRHLIHRPVLARPPSTRYLLRRFVERNVAWVAGVVVASIAITLGAATATAGFVRATKAEHAAQRQADTARATADFLIDLFQVSDPSESRGNTITARELLDRGAERIRTQLQDEPDVQSSLMNTIGLVYKELAIYPEALELIEGSLTTRRALFGDGDPGVSASLISLGEVYHRKGELEPAEAAFREALLLRQAHEGADSLAAAEAMNDLGLILGNSTRGQYTQAEGLYRQALAIYERERGDDGPEQRMIRRNLSAVLVSQLKHDEAEDLLTRMLDSVRAEAGPDDPEVAEISLRLANVLTARGPLDEAEHLLRETRAIFVRTHGPSHPMVGTTSRNLALVLVGQGRYEEAEALLREALRIFEESQSSGSEFLASARSDLGMVLTLRHQPDEAEANLQEALSLFARQLGTENPTVGVVETRIADLRVTFGRPEEALAIARQARPKFGADVISKAYATSVEAAALAALGRRDQAEALVPALAVSKPPKNVLNRIAMARAIDLYATWAPAVDVARLEDQLRSASFPLLESP
jgi:non-specific serine/threonine protein kinase/serine/threonine-protein kinase